MVFVCNSCGRYHGIKKAYLFCPYCGNHEINAFVTAAEASNYVKGRNKPKPDGEIHIETTVDNDGFKKSIDEMCSYVDKLQERFDRLSESLDAVLGKLERIKTLSEAEACLDVEKIADAVSKRTMERMRDTGRSLVIM